jgi:hypothetical protein
MNHDNLLKLYDNLLKMLGKQVHILIIFIYKFADVIFIKYSLNEGYYVNV